MLKVPYGQDPYSVIGKYIRDHITVIEDIIAVIKIDDITTNQLFMVDMNEEDYFIWNNDWYEGEKDVALIGFFPVSEAINSSIQPEPCEDAVNRADVVDMLEMYPFTEYSEYETAREVVKRLPSVTLKPKPCEDDKGCSNCMYSGRPTYKSPCLECHDNSQWEMKPISRSHENGTECEDAVSRAYKRGRMEVLQECDDIVSRKAALDLLYDILDRVDQVATVDHGIYVVAKNRMDALPSVTPKRKAMICGTCSHSDSETLYATNPPRIQYRKTGNLHFTTDYCDCDEINVEEQKMCMM